MLYRQLWWPFFVRGVFSLKGSNICFPVWTLSFSWSFNTTMYNYLILNTLCTNHLIKRFNLSPKAFLKNIRNSLITIRMGEDIISQNRSNISTIKSITESVDGGQFLNIRFFIFFNIFITFID